MTYAFVQDFPASWETYERVADAVGEAVPVGLIVHAAGRTDEGYRIIDVWESKDAWEQFRDGRLGQALEQLENRNAPPAMRELAVDRVMRP